MNKLRLIISRDRREPGLWPSTAMCIGNNKCFTILDILLT